MQIVGQEIVAFVGKPLQQERHQRDAPGFRQITKRGLELFGVRLAVVGWNLHPDQNHLRLCALRGINDPREIAAHRIDVIAAQSVVRAQRDNHNRGTMAAQRVVDAVGAAERGFPADAGVGDRIIRMSLAQAPGQQLRPVFTARQSITGGQAVAKHQYGCRARRIGGEGAGERKNQHGQQGTQANQHGDLSR